MNENTGSNPLGTLFGLIVALPGLWLVWRLAEVLL